MEDLISSLPPHFPAHIVCLDGQLRACMFRFDAVPEGTRLDFSFATRWEKGRREKDQSEAVQTKWNCAAWQHSRRDNLRVKLYVLKPTCALMPVSKCATNTAAEKTCGSKLISTELSQIAVYSSVRSVNLPRAQCACVQNSGTHMPKALQHTRAPQYCATHCAKTPPPRSA